MEKETASQGWFKLHVESDLKNLEVIAEFIAHSMRALGAKAERDIFEVQLAVDEACTNIVEHAYAGIQKGDITILCGLSDSKKEFIVKLIDTGKPFDPNSVISPDLEAPLEERKRGGYGIYFMKTITQSVKYAFTEKGNELTIIKLLQ